MPPVYATEDTLTSFIPGLEGDRLQEAVGLLEAAERDVDSLLPFAVDSATGRKLSPAWIGMTIGPWGQQALARAVAAQVEYLLSVPREKRVAGERLPSLVRGPDFEVSYGGGADAADIGPLVLRELLPLRNALVPRTARARP